MSEVCVLNLIGPMKIPLSLYGGEVLFHAVPKDSFTKFPDRDAAEAAIARSIEYGRDFGWHREQYVVVHADAYEAELAARARKSRVKRKATKEPEEE